MFLGSFARVHAPIGLPNFVPFLTFVLISLLRNASFNYKWTARARFRARARSDWAENFSTIRPEMPPLIILLVSNEKKKKKTRRRK
jgi:hypothetical protein